MHTILLVEDDAASLAMFQLLLELEGYSSVRASNGQDALTQLHCQTVDLVLSDWRMPGITGTDLYHHLRADPQYHGLPFILMSALPLPDMGSSDPHLRVLQKPFFPTQLFATIADMLAHAEGGTHGPGPPDRDDERHVGSGS